MFIRRDYRHRDRTPTPLYNIQIRLAQLFNSLPPIESIPRAIHSSMVGPCYLRQGHDFCLIRNTTLTLSPEILLQMK